MNSNCRRWLRYLRGDQIAYIHTVKLIQSQTPRSFR